MWARASYGPFLAMEFVPGKPLDGLIKAGAALPLKDKLRIAAGVAEALDHAHAKGIVHRDVKPGNVMITEDGRPKLMDFGIAKREDASLTQTGTFLGTPSYASPEQIQRGHRGQPLGHLQLRRAGLRAAVSGQSPFPGTSINTILYRIVNEPPVEVQPPVLGAAAGRLAADLRQGAGQAARRTATPPARPSCASCWTPWWTSARRTAASSSGS